MNEFKQLLKEIRWLKADLLGKDCLLTCEQSLDEIEQVLYTAEALDYLYRNNIATRCFDSGLALSIVEDRSISTGLAFASAANLLGLAVRELAESTPPFDTLTPSFAEVIGMRSESPGTGHNFMKETAAGLDEAYKRDGPGRRPGIINLGSDLDHPTRTLTALLHLKRRFGSLQNLKDKKIALTWSDAPGRGQSPAISQGLAALLLRFGVHDILAHGQGREPAPEAAGTIQHSSQGRELPAVDIVYDSSRVSRSQSFVIAAVILNNRFTDPAQVLEDLHKKSGKRLGI